MFPFKPVALSGKENQVSYANTRLPTEYGDEDDPVGPIVSVSNNYKVTGVGRSLHGEIATVTRQRGYNVSGTDQQLPVWMLPIMKEYLEKQEDIDLYRNEYWNLEEDISVVNRVV